MKFLKTLIKTFIFIIGALVSLWVLMPWGQIGEYAVLSAEKVASAKGFNTQHTSVSGSWRGPEIEISGFSSKMAFGGGEFETLSIAPSFTQSIIQFAPVISVSFTGGKLSLPGGNETDIGSGNVRISLDDGLILLQNIRNSGELMLDGSVAIDIGRARIDNADLMIKSPERIEQSLNSMKGMLPLVQESQGQWRLKREKING